MNDTGTRLANAFAMNEAKTLSRSAFQGKLRGFVPGLPCIDFYTAVYDLRDTGLAIVHLDGKDGGPVGIVAVIPQKRRRLLRNDFAFEFLN